MVRLTEAIDRLTELHRFHGDVEVYARDSVSGFEERVREVSAQSTDDGTGKEVIIEY